ncbi:MAG: amylo-alpha-1,6-glucosidase [Deltaproteobacteria bacterium]|nr:amylo-alpha-1,6-glucosidase [Deltaproteobacteria bacterium]
MHAPSELLPHQDGERPSILELASARDVDTLVRARGGSFLVTNLQGNVAPAGARELGLFDGDTRYLSFYELRVGSGDVVYLSAETSVSPYNQIDLMLSGLEREAVLGDPQNFLHIRRRQLLDDGFMEDLAFTNYLRREVTLDVRIGFDADFADMFEVRGLKRPRRGVLRLPVVEAARVVHTYRGLDNVEYRSAISFSPVPLRISAHEATFELVLPPGQTTSVEIRVAPDREGRRTRAVTGSFRERVAGVEGEAARFRERSAAFRCDDAVLQQTLDRSAADLYSLRLPHGEHGVLAAGIPWFAAPFGRDSLIASYEALPFNPDLAADSLRYLARHQGKRENSFTEEEPGKILHELRFGEVTRTGEMPHTPYYGSIDSTPLFVIVADAYYRVTGDVATIRALRDAIGDALHWIDVQSDEGRKFVSYQKRTPRGLDNQGWKDSWDSVVDADGTLGEPPIALCEVQGYCVDAYSRASRLFAALGEHERAAALAARARRLRDKIEEELWIEADGLYAYAVDGRGRRLRTLVSNLGHLLWSRVPSEERAVRVAEALMSPESFCGYGIRTLASGQTSFNPLSYHNGTVWPHDNALIAKGFANYRLHDRTADLFAGLHAACDAFRDRRIPELFCGMDRRAGVLVRYPVACSPQAWSAAAPYLFLQATLGIHFDAGNRELMIRDPRLPPTVGELSIENMRVGDSRVSMRFVRAADRCHVEDLHVTGPPLRVLIDISTGS